MFNLNEILPFLIPVVLIQICLQVYSIVDLIRRKKVRFHSKLLWGVVILGFQVLGAVAYLVFRGDEE